MTRISHFRAEIDTNKGSASRLAYGWQAVALNDRHTRIRVSASGDKEGAQNAAIEIGQVDYITSSGAVCNETHTLYLVAQDLEDLRNGKARLAVVRD